MLKHLKKRVIRGILFFIIISIIFSSLFVVYIRRGLEKTIHDSLQAVASQEALFLKEYFINNFDELSYFLQAYGVEKKNDSVDFILEELKDEVNRKSYIRYGIADKDGNARTTDGKSFSIADRDYFKKVLTGENVISEKLTDKVDQKSEIIVYATPIYRNNQVDGVFFATELAENLPKIVRPTFNKEQANIYIIDSNGIILSTTNSFKIKEAENIYSYIESKKNIKDFVSNNIKGKINYVINGSGRLAGFSNIDLTTDWKVLLTVREDMIMENANDIVLISSVFAVGNMIVLVLLFLIIFRMYAKFQKTKAEQEWLLRKSQIDPLSTIYNRATFEENVLKEINYILLFIDIDNFKYYNNKYGHAIGDEVITFIGKTLNGIMKDRGFVGRVGGDEFVACITDAHLNHAKELSEEILRRLEKGFYVNSIEKKLIVRCSIGISENKKNELDYEVLVKKADEAMYVAKNNGKGRYVVM